MAITDVSLAYEDPVTTLLESCQDEIGINPAGTHDADRPQVRWILQPRYACKISSCIGAPVAKKSNYFGLKIRHKLTPRVTLDKVTILKT